MGDSTAVVLEQRARAGLVGRTDELKILRGCLEPDGPLVTAIHGLAGVGKSTLLDAFLADARAAGATVIRLDGRTFEPTELGFLRAIGRAIRAEADDHETILARLGDVGDRVVLAIDTYEVLRLLESWLRLSFVPSLPPNARLVLATRDDPFGWSTGPLSIFRAVPLASLREAEAERLLTDAGCDPRTAARVNRLARGHPLALTIAAAALREQPDLVVEEVAPSRVFEAFARAYVSYLDPATRQALEATSVIRRATVSLLGAMLPEAAPHDAIERLRRLPFVEALHDGLALHETVQAATSAWLHANDPRRYRRLKLAAWRQLRAEVGEATPSELWRYTADMLWLVEAPVVREAFFPSGPQHFSLETARPDDEAEITAIVQRHHGPQGRGILGEYWRRVPSAFRVARDAGGHVAGFHVAFELTPAVLPWFGRQPVGVMYVEDLRRHPVPPHQRILFAGALLGAETGEAPSPVQGACWLDIKRLYMEMRPELRRVYSGIFDTATYLPVMEPLGFVRVPNGELDLDGRVVHAVSLDMGPNSVDGWLGWVVGSQLGIDEHDDEFLDRANRQVLVGGRRIDLTKLEFDLIEYLYQRRGTAVRREAMLKQVWGYDDGGGSNVLEATVHTLRAKLGDAAPIVETVRGIGYRLRA